MESIDVLACDDNVTGIEYLVKTLENNKPHICCATAVMTVTPQYRDRVRFLAINDSYEYSSMQIDLPRKYKGVEEADVEEYVRTLLEQGGDLISAGVWFRPKGYRDPYTLLKYDDSKWSTTKVKEPPDSFTTDAKTDLLDYLKYYDELTLRCADIYAEVKSMSQKLTYRVHLPVDYTEEEYEVFLQSLSHIQIKSNNDIEGYLWYRDGSWFTRENYSWERFTYPNVPIYLHKESSTPIPVNFMDMIEHWDGTIDYTSNQG